MKKIKNLLKGLMTLACLTGAVIVMNPTTAHAAETYTYTAYVDPDDPSKGTIIGTAELTDGNVINNGYLYVIKDGFLKGILPTDVTNISGIVDIPNTVKVIDITISNAATDNKRATKVTIPNSVEAIDHFIATDATELTIPSSVKYIGVYALTGNTKLTTLTIQEGCTHIDMFAFQGNTALKTVYLPSTIKKMSYN